MNKNLTALILAGGKAQRMGGLDKGQQLYKGRPLVEHVLGVTKSLVDSVVISTNQNFDFYSALADDVIEDVDPWISIGPLAGLYALVHEYTDLRGHVLLLPCDTPCISKEALMALISSTESNESKVSCLKTESGWQPLHAVIPVEKLQIHLPEYLEHAQHYGVMGFYHHLGCLPINWSNQTELLNINRLDEL
ncbi:molybdenum cofactor guanylyltransferase [Marinomonas ostreistagni]|uniref:Molybdenum cofactor guanylyltransferase n=1 Tax=Marinomonas ostreistagni TaxID=359209 RepID=A0ABS0ZDH7_9GAMM|nr:molybdenum cofactor guanylyltransferase [Marinomonas ostreistagni]MBJ7551735.1 molybdenum cofactor guanylyltransferase [Marinomonas ostreistagni]